MNPSLEQAFTVKAMFLKGWPIISVLLLMSIISLTVVFERLIVFMRAKMDVKTFTSNLLGILGERGPDEALKYCEGFSKPVSAVAAQIIKEPGDREAMERASRNAMQNQINEMESFIPILGTIASTAPFVGLFGTVVGIIRAFKDIAVSAGGGAEVVAAGIAEALVATAIGLFVAIPATIMFNYFTRRIQKMSQEIDVAMYSVIDEMAVYRLAMEEMAEKTG